MKHVLEEIQGPVGWGTAVGLALVSIPLAAVAVLVVRTFLVPLLVGAVVVMALLAVLVPPRYRDWVGHDWHFTRH